MAGAGERPLRHSHIGMASGYWQW